MSERKNHIGRGRDDSQADNSAGADPCPDFALNLRRAFDRALLGFADDRIEDHTAPARRTLWRERELLDRIPVISRGWAATANSLSDGRRQIMSFLLPGDVVSIGLIYGQTSCFSVEAVSDVSYRSYPRAALKAALACDAELLSMLGRVSAEETAQASRLAIDLGRRGAAERIANLILHLADRLADRGMVEAGTMDFPLRQHHIADATGLTVVHVGNTLSEFRRAGVVGINDRSLTILDAARLRHIALY